MSVIHRLAHAGGVDADGHVLEPPTSGSAISSRATASRALRLRRRRARPRVPRDRRRAVEDGARRHARHARRRWAADRRGRCLRRTTPTPSGAVVRRDGRARAPRSGSIRRTSQAAFLYPTLGVLWEAECTDAEIAQAYTRAYNRWIVDFCADSGGRLIPIAHLSLGDPGRRRRGARARGARRARAARGSRRSRMTQKPHGHPDHDRLFAAAQDLDVPIAIHPTFEPKWAAPGRFDHLHGTPASS